MRRLMVARLLPNIPLLLRLLLAWLFLNLRAPLHRSSPPRELLQLPSLSPAALCSLLPPMCSLLPPLRALLSGTQDPFKMPPLRVPCRLLSLQIQQPLPQHLLPPIALRLPHSRPSAARRPLPLLPQRPQALRLLPSAQPRRRSLSASQQAGPSSSTTLRQQRQPPLEVAGHPSVRLGLSVSWPGLRLGSRGLPLSSGYRGAGARVTARVQHAEPLR
jgi:hypothetical protein